jgi:hypothetical protein
MKVREYVFRKSVVHVPQYVWEFKWREVFMIGSLVLGDKECMQNVGGEVCREKSNKTNEKEEALSRTSAHCLL